MLYKVYFHIILSVILSVTVWNCCHHPSQMSAEAFFNGTMRNLEISLPLLFSIKLRHPADSLPSYNMTILGGLISVNVNKANNKTNKAISVFGMKFKANDGDLYPPEPEQPADDDDNSTTTIAPTTTTLKTPVRWLFG